MNSAVISQNLQNELLAKGIPALSPPCGAGAIIQGMATNKDMRSFKGNDWSQITPIDKRQWLHSDIKDKAFFYIHSFFAELLN